MRRSDALALLAPAHARVLALAEQGLDDEAMAAQLGVDASAVAPLLRIAREKLAALEALEGDQREAGGGAPASPPGAEIAT